MRFESLYRISSEDAGKSLANRAGLTHTFGGLATFLVLTCFGSGVYIIADALANPLAEQAAALIFAAFIIAFAGILFYYLVRPGTARHSFLRVEPSDHSAADAKQEFLQEVSLLAGRSGERKDLVYQRVYVDHSRIRP